MNVKLEDRLRHELPRLGELLESAPETPGTPEPGEEPPSETRRRESRRSSWLAVAAGLVVLASVAAVGVARNRGNNGSTATVDTSPATQLSQWDPLASGPLSPREDATSVWTGSEWLVLGGHQGIMALDDSAAYNPTTDTWRPLAVNPTMHPGAKALWTGSVAVVFAKGGGWIYDPAGDTWTDLPPQPDPAGENVNITAGVWTGHETIAIGMAGSDSPPALAGRSLDPSTTTWGPMIRTQRLAPSVSAMGTVAASVWDGSRVQTWLTTGEGWAYDPATRTWTPLPRLDIPGSTAETLRSITGIGSRTYALAYTATDGVATDQLAVFDNSAWTLVGGPRPVPSGDGGELLTSAGDELVEFSPKQGSLAIDPSSGTTRDLNSPLMGPGSGRTVVWTGNELLVFGGRDTPPNTGGNPPPDGRLTASAARLHS
jgi:hypothetical protein